jgi:hypothetical protein
MNTLFLALLLAQDKATVEGTVVNALTKEPLKKAHLTLDDGNTTYAVTSTAEGKFRFEGIDPGDYLLAAQRQGFVPNDDEPWHKLEPGSHLKDIVIPLMPQGVIAGHVVDEDGDPVRALTVSAARTIHVNGRPIVLATQGSQTDDEGYFLLSELDAGRYYLYVEPTRHARQPSKPGHPGVEEEFIRTDDPIPRDITPGSALRDIEIHVRKSAVFRIRGRISNPRPDSGALEIWPPDRAGVFNRPQANVRNGAFEFEAIPPGSYVLTMPAYATAEDLARNPARFCRVPVTITDHDIEGLVIDLTPGPSIAGTIKMDGGESFPKPPFVALHGAGMTQTAVAKDDGTFGWTNLSPVKYIFDYGPPNDDYVKSIQLNHQPATALIDLTSGTGGTLDIVIAPHAASVAISVDGGKTAQVALWSDSKFETWDTELDGTTSIDHLPPGDYQLLAFEKIESAIAEIPEFRARFDAQTIKLAEGSHENVELKRIPKSASDAEIAKLQ